MAGKAIVNSIGKNVARLIAENRRLRSENQRLEASRERLAAENRILVDRNAGLERSLTIKELATGFAGEGGGVTDRRGTKIARARVNRLLREVDKCIGLLNRE
jgi:hypothetical protein